MDRGRRRARRRCSARCPTGRPNEEVGVVRFSNRFEGRRPTPSHRRRGSAPAPAHRPRVLRRRQGVTLPVEGWSRGLQLAVARGRPVLRRPGADRAARPTRCPGSPATKGPVGRRDSTRDGVRDLTLCGPCIRANSRTRQTARFVCIRTPIGRPSAGTGARGLLAERTRVLACAPRVCTLGKGVSRLGKAHVGYALAVATATSGYGTAAQYEALRGVRPCDVGLVLREGALADDPSLALGHRRAEVTEPNESAVRVGCAGEVVVLGGDYLRVGGAAGTLTGLVAENTSACNTARDEGA